MRRLVLFVALTALAAPAAGPAQAHGPLDPRIRVVVDGIEPPSAEVRVVTSFDVQGLPPRMTARNDGTEPLEIIDAAGAPLFRIGPDGTSGNVRSAAYRAAVDPFGTQPMTPAPGGASAAPAWRRLSHEPVWRWYEDRAAFHGRVPPGVAAGPGPTDLARWTVPIRLGSRDGAIGGRVVWKVPAGTIRARVLPPRWLRDGISVTALAGPVPALQVRNTTTTPVEITGRDGAPFARISGVGVDVNTQSLTWADTKGLPDPSGDGPVWRHETDLPVYVWIERRAAFEQPDPPPQIEHAGKEAVLLRWEIPARLGAERVSIEGETFWRPLRPARDGSAFPAAGAGLLAGVAIIAAAMLRRHRRRPAE